MASLADKVGNNRRVFHRRGKPVDVQLVMIDCGTHEDVCLGYDDVRAFPTTLFLENSANKRRKYQGKLGQADELSNWVNKLLLGKGGDGAGARYHQVFDQGCRLSGFVDVARVPG